MPESDCDRSSEKKALGKSVWSGFEIDRAVDVKERAKKHCLKGAMLFRSFEYVVITAFEYDFLPLFSTSLVAIQRIVLLQCELF